MSSWSTFLTKPKPPPEPPVAPRRSMPSEEKSLKTNLHLVRQPQHNFEIVIGQVCARDISHDSLSMAATEIRPEHEGHETNTAAAVGVVVRSELSHNDARFVEKPLENSDMTKCNAKPHFDLPEQKKTK